MARVIAVARGHDGVVLREVGDKFDVPDARLKDGSTWFVPVKDAPKPAQEEANPRPPGAGPAPGSEQMVDEEAEAEAKAQAAQGQAGA